ncbi:MAG: hypothetical protein F6K11_12655 [Leptolyngbya sp. SIO3F4]|nr:hypothetical protein [Leptolyngbya sp. SIO3F4]
MTNPHNPSSSSSTVMTLLLGKLQTLLASPYGIAAIASLSFHGVLFLAVPRFSSASFAAFSEENATSEPRTVPLVTLSADEQGRLPNFNRPKLPSVPDFPSSNITRSSNSTAIRNLPSAGALTSRPNIFNRYSSRRIPTPPSITRPRLFNNQYSIAITDTPTRSEESQKRREAPISVPPPPTDTLETALAIEAQQAADTEQAITSPPEQTVDQGKLSELPENSSEVLDPENSELAANSDTPRQPTQLERLQAKFNYDDANTTEDEVEANYEKWITPSSEKENAIPIATAEPVELQIESGFNLCVENPPTDGEVGVLVAPDGTPSNPTILRSTGYEYLNQAALDAILAGEFPETETPVRYPFSVIVVDYDHETCQNGDDILNAVQNYDEQASFEE